MKDGLIYQGVVALVWVQGSDNCVVVCVEIKGRWTNRGETHAVLLGRVLQEFPLLRTLIIPSMVWHMLHPKDLAVLDSEIS